MARLHEPTFADELQACECHNAPTSASQLHAANTCSSSTRSNKRPDAFFARLCDGHGLVDARRRCVQQLAQIQIFQTVADAAQADAVQEVVELGAALAAVQIFDFLTGRLRVDFHAPQRQVGTGGVRHADRLAAAQILPWRMQRRERSRVRWGKIERLGLGFQHNRGWFVMQDMGKPARVRYATSTALPATSA